MDSAAASAIYLNDISLLPRFVSYLGINGTIIGAVRWAPSQICRGDHPPKGERVPPRQSRPLQSAPTHRVSIHTRTASMPIGAGAPCADQLPNSNQQDKSKKKRPPGTSAIVAYPAGRQPPLKKYDAGTANTAGSRRFPAPQPLAPPQSSRPSGRGAHARPIRGSADAATNVGARRQRASPEN